MEGLSPEGEKTPGRSRSCGRVIEEDRMPVSKRNLFTLNPSASHFHILHSPSPHRAYTMPRA